MKDNISRYSNITKDPSTTNFILPQIVLFFIAIVVAKSIISSWINITADRCVNSMFGIHELRSTLAGKSPWNVKAAAVSYKSGGNPKREKEGRMEQGILTTNTCLFMCVYECDEGCIRSSVPPCIEQILILKAYLFASRRALRTCVLRILPPCYQKRFQTLLQIAAMFIHSHI